MKTDVVVLGAGIVGVSVALHLAKRGKSVVLVDRQGAGEGTSFGNAGLIQREGGAPHRFPQHMPTLLGYMQNRSIPMRFQWRALPRWKEPERLAARVEFIVFARDGAPAPRPPWKAHFVEGLHPASATGIRQKLAVGEEPAWLPAPVAGYIRRKGLYKP